MYDYHKTISFNCTVESLWSSINSELSECVKLLNVEPKLVCGCNWSKKFEYELCYLWVRSYFWNKQVLCSLCWRRGICPRFICFRGICILIRLYFIFSFLFCFLGRSYLHFGLLCGSFFVDSSSVVALLTIVFVVVWWGWCAYKSFWRSNWYYIYLRIWFYYPVFANKHS